MLPKSVCNRAKCEVVRFLKLGPQVGQRCRGRLLLTAASMLCPSASKCRASPAAIRRTCTPQYAPTVSCMRCSLGTDMGRQAVWHS
jgi:hypothetical protein